MNEAARDAFNHELLCFLGASPTPFHAVGALAALLEDCLLYTSPSPRD